MQASAGAMKGIQPSEWAIKSSLVRRYLMLLFGCRRRSHFNVESRARGRSELFDQDDARETPVAGCHHRRHDAADHRTGYENRKLQRRLGLYYLKSQTKPGVSTIYGLSRHTTAKKHHTDVTSGTRCARRVADIKGGQLPQAGVVGGLIFNDGVRARPSPASHLTSVFQPHGLSHALQLPYGP